jgi:hypothetical protein
VSNGGAISDYDPSGRSPLSAYAGFISAFCLLTGAGVWAASRKQPQRGQPLQDKIDFGDLILLGTATHKLSRIITKDWVTAPVRAPFTEFKGVEQGGETKEEAKGAGVKLAAGQLLTCPWCMGGWIASLFTLGYALKPRVTRLVAGIFAVQAISDTLHLAYEALCKRTEG